MVDVHFHALAYFEDKLEECPPDQSLPELNVLKVPLAKGYSLVERPEYLGVYLCCAIGNITHLCLSEGQSVTDRIRQRANEQTKPSDDFLLNAKSPQSRKSL